MRCPSNKARRVRRAGPSREPGSDEAGRPGMSRSREKGARIRTASVSYRSVRHGRSPSGDTAPSQPMRKLKMMWFIPRSDPGATTEYLRPNGCGVSTESGTQPALRHAAAPAHAVDVRRGRAHRTGATRPGVRALRLSARARAGGRRRSWPSRPSGSSRAACRWSSGQSP